MKQQGLRASLIASLIIWHVFGLQCQLPCLKCATNRPSTCLNCSQNFYLLQGKCLMCSNGCLQCQSLPLCTLCNDSYFLENSVCSKCGDNCLKCLNNTRCQTCARQYFMSLIQERCIRCQENCLECSDENSCTVCLSGYYEANSSCMSCGRNCLVCTSSQACLTCADRFYVSKAAISNQSCLLCPDMCANCQLQQNCLLCGSTLICDKKCLSVYFTQKQCGMGEGKDYTLLILISVSSFIVFCILLFVFIRHRKKRRRLADSSLTQSTARIETNIRPFSYTFNFGWSKHTGQELDFITQCSVCLERGVNVCISCRHMFHLACFLLWIQKKESCPNCRNGIVHMIRIYCRVCHHHFVQKDITKVMRFRGSFDICDYCRYI